MKTQYIKKNGHRIGVMVAFQKDGNIQFGYSLLNPQDRKGIENENLKRKAALAAYKKENRVGKKPVAGFEQLPTFCKTTALDLAVKSAKPTVAIDSVPGHIRNKFYTFVRAAVAAEAIKTIIV